MYLNKYHHAMDWNVDVLGPWAGLLPDVETRIWETDQPITYSAREKGEFFGSKPLSDAQRDVFKSFVEGFGAEKAFSIAGVTGVEFEYKDNIKDENQTLIEAEVAVNVPPGTLGYAGGPNSFGSGEMYLGHELEQPEDGNFGKYILMHEALHTMGLYHPFSDVIMDEKYDTPEYTIMTYSSYEGHDFRNNPANGQQDTAQTMMMMDIAALQQMYGANYDTNSGDTTYTWTPGNGKTKINGKTVLNPEKNVIMTTFWDGGGVDTYDLSAYKSDMNVNLRPGGHSVFDKNQLADLGGGPNNGHARGNVFNTFLHEGNEESLIENVRAGSGADRITGNQADNTIWGASGVDRIKAGNGNDTVHGGSKNDYIDGGRDNDVLKGGSGNDEIFGETGNDLIKGDSGNDKIDAGSDDDRVYGGSGKDKIAGGHGKDKLHGGDQEDTVDGGKHDDKIYGEQGADVLKGGHGDDSIYGGSGADTVNGGSGDDRILGGSGADLLKGGGGDDVFAFKSVSDSKLGRADTIEISSGWALSNPGRKDGDVIHLKAIDADETMDGNQSFVFGSKDTGGLWMKNVKSETHIFGNTDDDAEAELHIIIADGRDFNRTDYSADDFIL